MRRSRHPRTYQVSTPAESLISLFFSPKWYCWQPHEGLGQEAEVESIGPRGQAEGTQARGGGAGEVGADPADARCNQPIVGGETADGHGEAAIGGPDPAGG